MKLRHAAALALWVVCVGWYVMGPSLDTAEPVLATHRPAAMAGWFVLMYPPMDPFTGERNYAAPLLEWQFAQNVRGFATAAECNEARDALITDGKAQHQEHPLIPVVQKQLDEVVESFRCIATDDLRLGVN